MRKGMLFGLVSAFVVSLILGTGLATWVFSVSGNKEVQLSYQEDGDDKNVYVDDIAENYYFASDMDSSKYYNVYFFPTPYAAMYSQQSTTYSSPVAWYDAMWASKKSTHTNNNVTSQYKDTCSVAYHGNSFGTYSITNSRARYAGFWGTVSDGSESKYYSITNPTTNNTNDGTIFGYKAYTNVYKQLSVSDYNTVGDCATSIPDHTGSEWFSYCCGFTTDEDAAVANWKALLSGYPNNPRAEMFDLSKPLSYYAKSGTKDVYLYPLYSNASESGKASIRMFASSNPGVSTTYKNMLVQTEGSATSDTYFQRTGMLVADGDTATSKLHSVYYKYANNTYGTRKDKSYTISFNQVGHGGGWSAISEFDFSKNFDTYLEIGAVYNIYIFFNDSSTTINSTIDTLITSKNIVHQETTSGNGRIARIYLERIYDLKLCGDVAGSYDYSTITNNLMLAQSSISGHTTIYETPEIVFPSPDYDIFGINYGSTYSESILSLDTDIDSQSLIAYDENDDAYIDPSKEDNTPVYYGTSRIEKIAASSQSENVSAQNIPLIQIKDAGVYKFRVEISYTDGLPSSIKVSAAYLRGLFIEIFMSNPTGTIGDTMFVDHLNQYTYRCDSYYNNEITMDDELFYAKGDLSNRYSLRELMQAKGKTLLLDRCTGGRVRIDSSKTNSFTRHYDADNLEDVDWNSSFTLDKNYIFYFGN